MSGLPLNFRPKAPASQAHPGFWRSLAALVALLFLMKSACLAASPQPAHGNSLAVGSKARTAAQIKLPIQNIAEFNYKTVAEIMKMRRAALATDKGLLLSGPYTPDKYVFGQVESERPWWGIYGEHLWGAGDSSTDGPSEESVFILNPYMLIAPEAHNIGIWNIKKLTPEEFQRPDFPFFWQAESLVYDPKRCRAEATYNITAFEQKVASKKNYLKFYPTRNRNFGFIAYNARDFGYNYLYVPPEGSSSVYARYMAKVPVALAQMLHCGGSCGFPGGCNNMSPAMPEIDNFLIAGLPAKITVHLWKARPRTVDQAPDFIYTINFK